MTDVFQFVVNRLEDFLNSNDQMLVNIEEVKVVWAVRDITGSVKGFLRLGKRHIPFMVLQNSYGEVEVWIKGLGRIVFDTSTIQTFIDEVKAEEAKRA